MIVPGFTVTTTNESHNFNSRSTTWRVTGDVNDRIFFAVLSSSSRLHSALCTLHSVPPRENWHSVAVARQDQGGSDIGQNSPGSQSIEESPKQYSESRRAVEPSGAEQSPKVAVSRQGGEGRGEAGGGSVLTRALQIATEAPATPPSSPARPSEARPAVHASGIHNWPRRIW